MALNPTVHQNTIKAAMVNIHYNNGGATLTSEQNNAIDYFSAILANADVSLIMTGTVNSLVTATIGVPPAVSGTAIGTIT